MLERGLGRIAVSVPRIRSGTGLAHSFALRLPSDGSLRFRPCLRLVLVSMYKSLTGFRYRGLAPHKFTPMPGVHQSINPTPEIGLWFPAHSRRRGLFRRYVKSKDMMEQDMVHHRVSNYQDHLQLLKAACKWMGIDLGRASQYTSLIKQFFENSERSREHILAYNESCEITEIYDLWKMQINDFPGLDRKICAVFGKGPVLREDERPDNSSNKPRNDAFVYLLAGKFIKAGINVVAVDGAIADGSGWKSDADITLGHNRSIIDVQCKRPLNVRQMQKRVKEACRQLVNSITGGRTGIVSLDCSAIIRPDGTLIEKDSAEDAVNFLGDLIERDIVPRAIASLDPNVLGLILFARFPAMIRKGQSSILSANGIPYRRYFRPETLSSSLVVPNLKCPESSVLKEIFGMLNQSLR